MSLLFWSAFFCLVAGGVVTLVARQGWLDTWNEAKRIDLKEFAIGTALCLLLVVPLTVFVGQKIALSNNLEFNEYWSGYELKANKSTQGCTRDGSCKHEYNCDPYTVTVIKTRSVSDGKGGTRTETYTDTETRYHDCPYSTEEWYFSIDTTLGDYYIETTFPDNARPYRDGKGLPGNVRQGTPPFWQAAHDRIAAGDPGPVTKREKYDNYILASQSSILKEFSDAIEKYGDIIPAPAKDVRDHYYADKAYFVGLDKRPEWINSVMRFNAAFGSELQGDLHVVLVRENLVDNPDEFVGALTAQWSSKTYGKNALSKNGLVVVLGVSSDNVKWARGFTGMPLGNERLLTDIRDLEGLSLNPDEVLGKPVGKIKGDDVTVTNGDGALESLVWGPNGFERVCMTCKEEGGGGFDYLSGEIRPNAGQTKLIIFAGFFLSLIVWGTFLVIGQHGEGKRARRRY